MSEVYTFYPKQTKKMVVFTLEYRPFAFGGPMVPIAAEVDAEGPYDLGAGYKGWLVTAPSGKTFVAEERSGAFVGPDIVAVRRDVASADPELMEEQVRQGIRQALGASRMTPETFWDKLKVSDGPAILRGAALTRAAEEIAMKAHEGQRRKFGEDRGQPYISHPRRIAAAMMGRSHPAEIAAAWLHDVLEDTSVTAKDLEAAGIPDTVIQAVKAMTRRPDETYLQYVLRAKANAIAKRVKRFDILDNMEGLDERGLSAVDAQRLDKYRLALHVLDQPETERTGDEL